MGERDREGEIGKEGGEREEEERRKERRRGMGKDPKQEFRTDSPNCSEQ